MVVCTSCRRALRQALRQRAPVLRAPYSTKPSAASSLDKPTWSIRSLLPSSSTPTETITPTQLHHLLRLSALPLPKSKAEEDGMIETLQSQLGFVRAVQGVDTTGVEPLRAIRDETEQGVKEITIGLEDLGDVLAKERRVGHYARPRRVKEKVTEEKEQWDVLGTASKRMGRFFVVESGKKGAKGEEG